MSITKCQHGKNLTVCKLCDGASICKHARRRTMCKDCKALGVGGGAICKHNRERSRCKECGGGSVCKHNTQRSWCSRCNTNGAYKQCRRSANKREIPFELTLEEFKWIMDSSCLRCGESFAPMSCDRVDSDRGYSFYNCQPLCDTCNRMKMDSSEEEFEQKIVKIIRHCPELIEHAKLLIQ